MKHIIGFSLILASLNLPAITLGELLTYQTSEPNLIVQLQLVPSYSAININEMHLHFLTSKDCQSGYMKRFDVSSQDNLFLIDAQQPFGVRGEMVYAAALSAVGQVGLEQVGSVLFRMSAAQNGFLYFKGTCDDQGLNCCIPITCSHFNRNCQSQCEMGTQMVYPRG